MNNLIRTLIRAALTACLVAFGLGQAHAQIPSPADGYGAYLFVYFKDDTARGQQTYMATSTDGQNWTDLNNGRPVLYSTVGTMGARDHSIVRSPDGTKFWILATDLQYTPGTDWGQVATHGSTNIVIWESSDLVNWSKPRLANVAGGIQNAGCAWAPEAIWDPDSNAYIVYWTTETSNDGLTKIYYATTQDFVTFSAPQVYIGDHLNIRDTQVRKIDGAIGGYRYFRASAGYLNKITFEGSQRILDSHWTPLGTLDQSEPSLNTSNIEAPIIFKYNGQFKWGLLVDNSPDGYVELSSTNVANNSWQLLASGATNLSSQRKRHGGILNITSDELARLRVAGGPTQYQVRLQSDNYPDRYVRHYNFRGRIDANVAPADDAKFTQVRGLANATSIYASFESVNFPGYYLRNRDSMIVLEHDDGSPQFAADATFMVVSSGDGGLALQSYNHPTMSVRHYNFELWLQPIVTSQDRQDSTFRYSSW